MKKLISAIAFLMVFGFSIGEAAAATSSSCNPNHKPIILIHGWADNNRTFNVMKNYLSDQGFSTCKMYTFRYSSTRDSNKTSARRLRNYVNSVSRSNGGQKVTIVAHSNGGLVSRWYRVFEGGYSKNDRFVSLGTPHSGTTSAYLCFDPACYEMRPGSTFLRSLAGRGCDYAIWSEVDAIINPSSSARCGRSYRTAGLVDHEGLLWRIESLSILKNLIPKY